jgi:hypothetical protein
MPEAQAEFTSDPDHGSARTADDRMSVGDYALLALHNLGGGEHDVDIEDIAVEAFRLAPSMFSWRRYKQFPSLEVVRIGFRNLEGARSDHYVVSHRGHNRMLTSAGIRRAREVRELFGLAAVAPIEAALRRPVNRDLARMTGHPAYKRWKESGTVHLDQLDLGDLVHMVSGAPTSAYHDALLRAQSQATSLGHVDLAAFLDDCLAHLNEILTRSPL